jgi:sulfide:quinone oxidoreductase
VRAGDSVLVCVSRLPYQCPPAPFEFVFLIHDMLVQQGVRDRVRLAISVPLPAGQREDVIFSVL